MSVTNVFDYDKNLLSLIVQVYERSEKTLTEDVFVLEKWMKTQSHLPEVLDKKRLQNFLILNKFSIERAKQSIDMYYTLRTRLPELYSNPRDLKFMEIMDYAYWVSMPKLTEKMYRVNWFKVHNKKKFELLHPYQFVKVASSVQEIRLKEDILFGDVCVFDLEDIPSSYFFKVTPTFLSKVYLFYKKIYSLPLKGVYFLNSPPFLNPVLNIVKTMVKQEIFDRFYVCKDTSIIYEVFPKEMIPKDYGGEEKSLKELNELLKLKFQQYQDHFDYLDTLKVNESLRPEKLNNDDVFGFHGNFKKLNFD